MATDTLHFENPRITLQILGNENRNLAVLQDQLGIRATARDTWIKLEGPAEAVSRARELLQFLEAIIKNGGHVRQHDFMVALGIIKTEGISALQNLNQERIQTSPRKSTVIPKTVTQKKYIQAIKDHDITLGIGPAGTGKTYLAMAMAAAALRDVKVGRLILTRPAVEAGEALGFLPGDLQEKLAPYLRPLYDALHDMLPAEEIQRHMERGTIEIAPLAYMRGRTLNHSFIIFDEAQNSTAEQMFMFLTRLGHSSKAVITGDVTQIDLPKHKPSGLIEARQALAKVEGISIVEFAKKDVIRHPLVQRILAAYETHRGLRHE
jgi:phosphate starvation-inducible PhoH-like protein